MHMRYRLSVTLAAIGTIALAASGHGDDPAGRDHPQQPSPAPVPKAVIDAAATIMTAPAEAAPPEVGIDWISRSRTMSFDVAAFRELLEEDAVGGKPAITLPLFEDATFVGRTRRITTRGDDRILWLADLLDVPGGYAIISAHGGTAYGMISAPERGLFEFHPLPEKQRGGKQRGRNAYLLREVDAHRLPPCGVGPEHCAGPAANAILEHGSGRLGGFDAAPLRDGSDDQIAGEDTPVIRLLVAYTPAARTAVGGEQAMLAFIDATIAQTNLAVENSAIDLHAELALAHEVSYAESDSIGTDLQRLTNPDNGYMDEVHVLRANAQADLVALLVTGNGAACGVGWCMSDPSPDFAELGFSVTRIQCVSNLTFPHELGHNMGCHHDHQNSGGSCGVYPYSFGHRFFGFSGNQHRTILAYSPGDRIPHFSNPDVFFDGQATGVPIGASGEAHNAQSITLNAPLVASFSDQLQPETCLTPGETRHVPQDMPTIQQAIDASSPCDIVEVAPGVYHETIDFNGRIVELRSTDGPDVTVIDGSGNNDTVVRFVSSETPAAVIDGFTLTGGGPVIAGGGIEIGNASPTIRNCIIAGNAAMQGGGIFNNGGNPTVENTVIENNIADEHGGGMFNATATAVVIDTVFRNNLAQNSAGAVFLLAADATLTNCLFENNESATDGGAMRAINGSNISITGCSFRDNLAGGSGGGAFFDDDQVTFIAESDFCGNDPDHIAGPYSDAGGNSFVPGCPVAGDLNQDGLVDGGDLLILLSQWGECSPCHGCEADLDGDCSVDGVDLLILLSNWG